MGEEIADSMADAAAGLPPLSILFQRFGIALAIGLLIGIEREREKAGSFAGIRTFPLIALLGCAAGMISDLFSPLMFPVTFVVIAALVLRSYVLTGSTATPGITTEVAALLAFVFGGLVWWDMRVFAAAAAVVTVLLLAAKQPLEELSRRIGHTDIVAAVQFGVITLIVLPLLPNRTYGPLDVINPHLIWILVVLVAGINLIGYALVKILGSRHGLALTGILGGLASSTAITLGFSRRSQKESALAPALALAILIACTIMFARILVIAASISHELGRTLILPMAILFTVGLLTCLVQWHILRLHAAELARETGEVTAKNPLEIWTAVQFGLLFGVILLIAKAAQVQFHDAGIYISSTLAGFTDVDAITLSLSNLAATGTITAKVAAQGVVLAGTANTILKGGIILGFGGAALRRYLVPAFTVMILCGLVVVFLVL